MPRKEQAEERLLAEYLLGTLPEEKQAEVEDRAFADQVFLSEVQAAEADLIDAYARDELSQTDRRNFEQRFLASPQRRSKVEFARTLVRVADKHSPVVRELRPSAWQGLLALFGSWARPAQLAAGMAALLFVAGVSWLMLQDRAMRTQVAELQQQSTTLAKQTEALQRQLEEERSRASRIPAPGPIASLILMPGLTRGEAGSARLAVGADAQLARIEIQLEARDDFPRFRAELRTTSGEDILTRGNLSSRRAAGGLAVTLDVPASALAPGQYELALKGVPRNESARDIGFYYFTVLKN